MLSNSVSRSNSAYSPSLKTSVGSGWVSLHDAKSDHSRKSFVGSVNRDTDMDEYMEPGRGSEEKEVKEKILTISLKSIKSMQSLISGVKSYPIRLSGSATAVNSTTGDVAPLLALWNPIANAEFVDFAVLFTEYKVVRHKLTLWFTPQSAANYANLALVGSDPAVRLTLGTLTTSAVSNLGDVKRYNPQSTTLKAIEFTSGQKLCDAALQSVPLTRDGWQLTSDAWGGQTALFAQTLAATGLAFYYQQTWDIHFRCRV
jgi:hypothetical protein